ncbi:MAG: tetratricopeptide repeat protein [Opitutales bacterium]
MHLCALLLWAPALVAQAPLTEDTAYASGEVVTIQNQWRIDAARMALGSGLPATASDIYASLLEKNEIQEAQRSEVLLDYVAALIAQSRYEDAFELLNNANNLPNSDRLKLYLVTIRFGIESIANAEALRDELANVKKESLAETDLPWYYLLQGVLADYENRRTEAKEYFQLAQDNATSSMQSALFASLILRQRMLTTPGEANLLVEIREKFESLAGQSAAFPFLRQYLILLHSLGKDAEAIEILEAELANTSADYSIEERSGLLLLKGLILGLDSAAGWASLKELVRAGIDSEATLIALHLLGSSQAREADLMLLLNEVISRPEPHPLVAQLYYMRCQLALANPETTALAQEDARRLLEQFPGFSEITSVYRLLAYAAIQREPPRYRVAADYLLELREQSSGPSGTAGLNRLIGDCYFLNRDYANASDFYESAKAELGSGSGNVVLLRLVISQIRSGKFDDAIANIDQADFAGQIDDADRWRAEWSIALALQADGQAELALRRLRLLVEKDTSSVPASLDLRLRWLEAHLSLKLGESAGTSEKLGRLLARIDSLPEDAMDADDKSRLKSELLLLNAESLLAVENRDAAFDVISEIRVDFQDRIAAERSYFIEAAYHASLGDYRSAQQTLTSFTLDYPNSTFIPQALFEASLHCQRQGPDSYGEAVILLDRLVQDYPDSGLAYHAGLKQGDLLRLMNDFAGAQQIYENLINSFPAHRLRYASELSLADCISALSQGSDDQLLEASAILERLVDRPDLPAEVKIEAGFKWGNILARTEEPGEAKTIFGLMTGRYLLEPGNAASLSSVGRYWLSRTIFSLCEILESDGEVDEAENLYRKLVAFNLPGRGIALSRINQLQLAETL